LKNFLKYIIQKFLRFDNNFHHLKTSGKNVGIVKNKDKTLKGHTLLKLESQLQFPEASFRDLRQVF